MSSNRSGFTLGELPKRKLIAFPIAGCGGARRDRTDDLMLAKHALYQLSYGPIGSRPSESPSSSTSPPEVSHDVWWAQADSNCRPHAYQACALTS